MPSESIYKGARWNVGISLLGTALSLIQIPLLARFLQPEHFGTFGAIFAICTIATTFASAAFADYIIVVDDPDRKIQSTLYWTCATLSVLTYIGIYFTAPILARTFTDGHEVWLLRIAALQVIIAGLTENFRASLRKNLHFKSTAMSNLVGVAAGLVASVFFLLFYRDERVLIYSNLINQLMVALALFWLAIHYALVPTFLVSLAELRRFLRPGAWRLSSYLLNSVNSRLDLILISSLLGTHAAGLYFVAWKIVAQPLTRFLPFITQLALPLFSKRAQDPISLQRAYRTAMSFIAFVLPPMIVISFLVVPYLLDYVLGSGWSEILGVTQVLIVLIMARVFTPLISVVMLSLKDYGWATRWQIAMIVGSATAGFVAFSIQPTLVVTTAGIVLGQSLVLIYMYRVFIIRLNVSNPMNYLLDIVWPIVISVAMLFSVDVLFYALDLEINNGITAGLIVIVCLIYYGLATQIFLRRQSQLFFEILLKR